MNWRRGTIRLWLVASGCWLAIVAWSENVPVAATAVWKNYPSQETVAKERSTGVILNPDGSKCVQPSNDPLACIYSPLDAPMTREAAFGAIREFAVGGLGPPVGLAIIGLVFSWIAAGFRKSN
jgi:hypothetical protein